MRKNIFERMLFANVFVSTTNALHRPTCNSINFQNGIVRYVVQW